MCAGASLDVPPKLWPAVRRSRGETKIVFEIILAASAYAGVVRFKGPCWRRPLQGTMLASSASRDTLAYAGVVRFKGTLACWRRPLEGTRKARATSSARPRRRREQRGLGEAVDRRKITTIRRRRDAHGREARRDRTQKRGRGRRGDVVLRHLRDTTGRVDLPWRRVAATPRLRRGYFVDTRGRDDSVGPDPNVAKIPTRRSGTRTKNMHLEGTFGSRPALDARRRPQIALPKHPGLEAARRVARRRRSPSSLPPRAERPLRRGVGRGPSRRRRGDGADAPERES